MADKNELSSQVDSDKTTWEAGLSNFKSSFDEVIKEFNSISSAYKNLTGKNITDLFNKLGGKTEGTTEKAGGGLCCPCKNIGSAAAIPAAKALEKIEGTTKKSGGGLPSLGKNIGSAANQKAMELFHDILEKIEGTTKKAGGGLASLGKNMGSAAAQAGKMTLELGKQAIVWATVTAKMVAHKIATTAASIAQKAMTVAQAALNLVMSANPIGLIVIAIGALIAALVLLFNNCKPFHDWVVNAFTMLKSIALSTLNAICGFFTKTIPNALNTMKNFAIGIWNNIAKFLNPTLILDAVQGVFNPAINWIKNLSKEAMGWGKDIMHGIANGIKSAVSAVRDAVYGVAQNIRSFLHFSTPDEGPLADFDTYMPDMMGSLAQGMKVNLGKVRSAAWEVAAAMSIPEQLVTFGVAQKVNAAANIQTAQKSAYIQQTASPAMANIVLNLNGYEVGRILTPIMSQTIELSAQQKSLAIGG